MTKEEIRQALLESTVNAVASVGFEGATTKAIASSKGINEAYIYRLFGGKEKLFAATFEMLDLELISAIHRSGALSASTEDVEGELRRIFSGVWRFVMNNRDRCFAYVRYYFSNYYIELSHSSHMAAYASIVSAMSPLFRERADVTSLLHHVLSSLLDFAVRVHNGDIPDDSDSTEHIFRVLFCVFRPYLRDTEF